MSDIQPARAVAARMVPAQLRRHALTASGAGKQCLKMRIAGRLREVGKPPYGAVGAPVAIGHMMQYDGRRQLALLGHWQRLLERRVDQIDIHGLGRVVQDASRNVDDSKAGQQSCAHVACAAGPRAWLDLVEDHPAHRPFPRVVGNLLRGGGSIVEFLHQDGAMFAWKCALGYLDENVRHGQLFCV